MSVGNIHHHMISLPLPHFTCRESLKGVLQVVVKLGEHVNIDYLLQAGERNFFISFHTTWGPPFRVSLYNVYFRPP